MTAVVEHLFHVEMVDVDPANGRQVDHRTFTQTVEAPPTPADTQYALAEVERWWREEFAQYGQVVNVWSQKLGPNEWKVGCELESDKTRALPGATAPPAVPSEPPIINVTIPPIEIPPAQVTVNITDEPIDATVSFRRNPDGTIKSATIAEQGGAADA